MSGNAIIAAPPSDLEAILDTRVKDMLSSCTEPKDLIQAVKAATAYLAVKNKLNDQEGFGAGFKDD